MEYADYLKTDTMPPALPPGETDEERKRRLIASAGGLSVMPPVPVRPSAVTSTPTMPTSPRFTGAAIDAARSRPAIAGTDRGNALPERDAFGPDSREFFQNALTSVRPSVTPTQPSSAPSTANTMPPVPLASAPRSEASASALTGRDKELAIGATAQPKMPPVRMLEQPAAPDLGAPKMPPVTLNVTPGAPARPATIGAPEVQPWESAEAVQKMPPVPVGPEMQRYKDLAAKGEPKLSNWKKVLDVIGSLLPFGRAVEMAIPGSPQNYDARLMQAAVRAAKEQSLGKGEQEREKAASEAQFNTPEKRRAYMQQNPDLFDDVSDFEKHDWVLSGKFPQKEPAPEKTTDKKIDEYTNDQGKRVLTFQRANGETYDRVGGQTQPKTAGHTSPFEAFAYGDPEEKKAAQDYLDFEKKSAARYRTPNEFEEKFRLFKEDPDTYKAMFGEKGGAGPDRATATKMLNYFDKRRREVQGDFTLDDNQKQEQLKDIENLEKPFLAAVQPGAAGDRVKVIGPDGTPGTVPRSQLEKAKKKGYRVAQ